MTRATTTDTTDTTDEDWADALMLKLAKSNLHGEEFRRELHRIIALIKERFPDG